ncbi:prenyltransferase/squalene oxidase repeat-containing protein [Humisphaera borealis]|uniref:Squalene--hopene cyclase n=1 Tax=Humisphaera borealis TaxID=2807512 RepID=A0A7M2WTK1_9BACT|nr:prenyltransferase/squalene oxidase repeat-containing protein [Humisphaera borealis]QOV88492.1 squalene--hopene cyclase [Humisphaera borealis]
MPVDPNALKTTLDNATRALLDARGPHGHWEGELSSSALSTATAVFALSQVLETQAERADPAFVSRAGKLIRQGLGWLALNQNSDGGWGDTTLSLSNISTTCLCWAAFVADENWAAGAYESTLRAVEKWLIRTVGTLAPDAIASAIVKRYGEDHTFSVPILTMCAMAGRLGLGPAAWDLVPALPFELAAFPQRMFKWLKLPVVSYALPALIAIGQVRHARRPSGHSVLRTLRNLTRKRTLKLLTRIQPTTGGFLEATPLTSFVVMSLAAAGNADHPVVKKGVEFLTASVRDDGSWPIDTNLATWVTTLAVNALANHPEFDAVLPESERKPVRDWLLGQQYRKEHPYTLANPGGWAWTDLPGGVPDADDTPGALIALRNLGSVDERVRGSVAAGLKWLAGLQNRDGGMPTFCKGWGKLPFDKSSTDLTAHALRAGFVWKDQFSCGLTANAVAFLVRGQHRDGSWTPLWFGNQHLAVEENPVYATSRVLLTAGQLPAEVVTRAVQWLLAAQHESGGWGGGPKIAPSIEETALALEALASLALDDAPEATFARGDIDTAIERGVSWLIQNTRDGTQFPPSPIGFYFAKLWYFEKLYPLVWVVSALGKVMQTSRSVEAKRRGL